MPRPKGSLNKKTLAKVPKPKKGGWKKGPMTEEAKAKASEARKKWWADRKAAIEAGEPVKEMKKMGKPKLIDQLKARTPTEAEDAKKLEELIKKLAYAVQYSLINTYNPNRAQVKFHDARNEKGEIPRVRLLQGSNKVGKTTAGVCEDIAHALGYRPWLAFDHPDYKVPVKVPNNGLVLGETIVNSVDKKLIPEFIKWLPQSTNYETRKNPQGVIVKIHLPYNTFGKKCGSTIYFGSYDQPAETQEGIDWHWVHYDEPPPHDVFIAVERGKIAMDARSWMTMTPLKEAWILDDIVEKADFDKDVSVVVGEIWDNAEKNGGVLKQEAIDEFIKKLDPDEYEARVLGKWKHLAGLVYGKWWKDELHVIDDFNMERCFRAGWTPYEAVDPHDNRATCWLFGAMGNNERLYIYDYLLVSGTVAEIAHKVKVKREMHGYANPQIVVLDKKHGQKHNAALAEGKSWQEELEKCGIKRIELSDSKPGDVELGHKLVKKWLEPAFSPLMNKEVPKVMFFRQGAGGEGGPIYQMKRYSYDDLGEKSEKNPNPKPKDLHKDFPDTIRYMIMKDPKWHDPAKKKAAKDALLKRQQEFVGMRRRLYGYGETRV